jgi:hypothetical protein
MTLSFTAFNLHLRQGLKAIAPAIVSIDISKKANMGQDAYPIRILREL